MLLPVKNSGLAVISVSTNMVLSFRVRQPAALIRLSISHRYFLSLIHIYINAINENTGVLLKVHTSNFKVTGFTEEVSLEEMVEIGHAHGVPVIYDLGSGLMCSLAEAGIFDEPMVKPAVRSGADVISFSGDKLLGGPQAGIIVGKKEYIEKMRCV